jgi:hypothetical protein
MSKQKTVPTQQLPYPGHRREVLRVELPSQALPRFEFCISKDNVEQTNWKRFEHKTVSLHFPICMSKIELAAKN